MAIAKRILVFSLLFPVLQVYSEQFRTIVDNTVEAVIENLQGTTSSLGINSSLIINLGDEIRFFNGIEIEITAPQNWLSYRGSVGMSVYNRITPRSAAGVADIDANRIVFEPLPAKIKNIYQIPIRNSHGLRTSPYITVLSNVTRPETFPILFRFMSIIKGMSEELESMVFDVTVRPLLSNEGAVRIIPRFPPQLRDKPFIVLIDDNVVENLSEPYLLKEGQHHLVLLSEDYRNERKLFMVEKAKITVLSLDLQDPAPLILFEGPENIRVYLDNTPVTRLNEPMLIEPGQHEVRILIGDYTILKTLNIQKGKTYRVSLTVDLTVNETE
jgi:hypothetical protein